MGIVLHLGWEKAAALKQQLDASTSKVSSLEDRNSHLDSSACELQAIQDVTTASVHEDLYPRLEAFSDNEMQSPSEKTIGKTSMEKLAALPKVEMVEVEKLHVEMGFEWIQRQSRLKEIEGKLSEMKKLEAENQELGLLLGESGKQMEDLQRQLNKAQVRTRD
ncbi:hypothetical protein ARALYDRAFT_895401 [Arabidopsis lyrata subsp. lyrata]|uniref:Uncharacterized protein n=1 Tax=Arabidopsis lyrata subsp. lyrata TaxID=81972 RepID=D7KSM9_ARALL|nr:hypothetical protein ARALYDRAFT_895401 [Arabidopsis lyrata subsp. lyrata]